MTKDVRGAAFYDSLDDPQNQYVYGVVEYHISQPITAVITAHEIGHIFNGYHINGTSFILENVTKYTIMHIMSQIHTRIGIPLILISIHTLMLEYRH